MFLKKLAVASVFALGASSVLADVLPELDFAGGNTASFTNTIDPNGAASLAFDDSFSFVVPTLGSSLGLTLAGSASRSDEALSFSRIYVEDAAAHQFQFVVQGGDDSVFAIQGPQLTAGATYTLHVQGVATDFTSYNGEISVLPAVPEPTSYAMMLAGLGLLGVAARRRQGK